ncbi:stage II sporulation protein E [Cytobacillus horneckiae]|uniref:Stage II sporulation protein E n=1 Tax=Cytobacillus horneckiae TaxID=549687 RepID=A0A2N0ZDE3_9BACI|nr:stage II sporulation protein E [Cytobacillus horneckiae]MBN6889734.1 stage II sporulation protein E [Cytobacillus horneckiae]MCM3181097.1 stage II sporulation protein E [Cytobacillus horneckiae]MEC1154580.1 stage II sporulation protein E [Cytobacillus horneckiae]MED2939371.1 stage II sporulation protein E [Cytobacillus horneckiae]PKG27533.1 stage II sporulation protein E [Cytobacillus horneckiae]
MEKLERTITEPIGEVDLNRPKVEIGKLFGKIQAGLETFFIKKGYLFLIIGFLLGRALILSQLTPFTLPFFAAIYLVRREKAPLALIGLIGGAATLSFTHAATTFIICFLFLFVFRISKKWVRNELKVLPFFVAGTLLAGTVAKTFILKGHVSLYELMMAGVEASLGFILCLIFLQSLPLLSLNRRRQSLKTEEIVCLIIMLASVMTGTIGWNVYDLSVEHIMSRYLVLIFAFVAGATVGSTVGVVTGLIFSLANISSLYHMSLLAFSGLLGGLLKEGRKIGVALGLLIATLLMGMYVDGGANLIISLYETGAAILLFLLTPQNLTMKLSKHIPGTPEYAAEQQQYMRKMRDVTAQRVSQFSNVFQALSKSFSAHNEPSGWEENSDREFDYFLSNVTEKTCQTCFKKDHCWARNFDTTYDYMKEIMNDLDYEDGQISPRLAREWDKHCTRAKKTTEVIQQELTFYKANQKLKKQVQESRKLVADQLLGVSAVMGDFAKEIQRERENHHKQEELILEAMQEFGIQVEQVEIYSLEQGNVDIEMTIPYCNGLGECEKLIAPMLSDILGETILVNSEECAAFASDFCHVTFHSAKAFVVDTAVAHAAKDGGLVSGDSYSTIQLGSGKYAIAISDGMGNGERAHSESQETLQLLQKILQSGIEEQVAIKSVNSVLSLRTTDEIFSTLDLAMIDLQNADAKFLKIGSTPSFIKRGAQVMKVQASNLPIGIIEEFDVDVVSKQLKAEDLLIMMSDGVFEGPKHVENFDLWMKRKITELKTDDPQEVADLIMEEVIRSRSGHIEDDMTVVVSKVKHNIPKWSSIPLQKKAN